MRHRARVRTNKRGLRDGQKMTVCVCGERPCLALGMRRMGKGLWMVDIGVRVMEKRWTELGEQGNGRAG